VAEESAFQSIHIFDALKPYFQDFDQYMNSLSSGNETYEAQNPGYFAPDRLVFLDGILQSRRSGDAAYHEALVHPAMFAHRNPKRVAIVGGGEGATLREVLKHNTVEKVVMVEIDELIVKISKESLPEWNDCSSLAGSTPSCFDDPRTDLQLTDAFAWFIDRFGEDGSKKGSEPKFDVIIMDAL
jgi:spermidine synthase